MTTAMTVMSPTQTLERNNETGLTDSTHSSSSSAERYRLDEFDDKPILLYKYRGRLQTSSQKNLCAWLDKGELHLFLRGESKANGKELSLQHRWLAPRNARSDFTTLPIVREECTGAVVCLLLRSAKFAPPSSLLHSLTHTIDTLTDISTDEKLRVTRKAIPRYTSYVDIKRHDLYVPSEKQLYADFPNYNSNLASIKVPSLAYWSRLLFGNYQDLYIVSPESSPSSSVADEDSRRSSPTSTWARDDSDEMKLGAMQDNSNDGQA